MKINRKNKKTSMGFCILWLLVIFSMLIIGACNTTNNKENEDLFLMNNHDISYVILGVWIGENNLERIFYHFMPDTVVVYIMASAYIGKGNWSIAENGVYFDGEERDHDTVRRMTTFIPIVVIDYNTIKIHETIYTRYHGSISTE